MRLDLHGPDGALAPPNPKTTTLAPQHTLVATEALPLAGLRETLGGLDGRRIRRKLLDAR